MVCELDGIGACVANASKRQLCAVQLQSVSALLPGISMNA